MQNLIVFYLIFLENSEFGRQDKSVVWQAMQKVPEEADSINLNPERSQGQ